MDISLEAFHVADVKCGVVIRRSTPRAVRTVVCWRRGTDGFRVDSLVEHDGDIRRWTRSTCTDATGTHVATHRDPDDGVLPSSAERLVLDDMLASSATEAEFLRLRDADPGAPALPAYLSVGNPEPVTLPSGRRETLGTVDLFVAGEVTNRFWFDSEAVVASDWSGARSYRVETLTDLLAGLHPDIAAVAREMCSRRDLPMPGPTGRVPAA